ncbi:hypothetical protein ABR738_14370 [Streptomyces sp. Edi4]|uniref:hypothetical protein n=1 Tax=Streptomyces sp. Edi4 TaxID=3162527 RepID=UPI00330580A0
MPSAVAALESLGVKSVKIFAGSRIRDARASQGASPTGLMARSIRAAKKAAPGIAVMTETCVCSHNDSGECWLADERGAMDLEETTEVIAAPAGLKSMATDSSPGADRKDPRKTGQRGQRHVNVDDLARTPRSER